MLFVGAKVSHLALLPQGRPEAARAPSPWCAPWTNWVSATAAMKPNAKPNAPKEISISNIARLNREFYKAAFGSRAK
jgi:succinate dehydrogenase / fumarate reductase, iron-sulfur subunit